MTPKTRPTAFVAMKFGPAHWRDKTYIAITEELEHAGFSPLRSDQIRTSGPVVDEVCRLLREAELVVIDSTGDSHSVSYEIGYCHGANRPAETILLLRKDSDTLPFNYQHYRHRIYGNLRSLRRLIRDHLKVYEPLYNDQHGYTFTFDTSAARFNYGEDCAFCIFDALRVNKFSGMCECYAGDHFGIPDHLFSVGVTLRFAAGRATPDYKWWSKLEKSVARQAKRHKDSITFDPFLSELGLKSAMLATLVPSGVAEFSAGRPIRLLGSDDHSYLRTFLDRQKQSL